MYHDAQIPVTVPNRPQVRDRLAVDVRRVPPARRVLVQHQHGVQLALLERFLVRLPLKLHQLDLEVEAVDEDVSEQGVREPERLVVPLGELHRPHGRLEQRGQVLFLPRLHGGYGLLGR